MTQSISGKDAAQQMGLPRYSRRPLIVAGMVLGLGQAGFFDGIVLHQLLQWHHMFSSVASDRTVAGIELNTLGDGLFHLFDWLLTLTGLGLLWRVSKQPEVSHSTSVFVGSLLMGAGLFDVVEGLVDHQWLGIHHVKPGPHELAWDVGFLALGLGLFLLGWAVVRRDTIRRDTNGQAAFVEKA
jgi:uncharacterized membrane protein